MYINFGSKIKILLFLSSIFLFSSCDYVDILSVAVSKQVDLRFDENQNLPSLTSPVVTDSSHYRFLVISDTHYFREEFQFFRAIESIREQYEIEFLIVNGDVSQSGLEKQYEMAKNDRSYFQAPVYFVIGNHDLFHDGSGLFGSYFGRYIDSFEIGQGNSKFIFLDTANGILGKKQKDWYKNQLKLFQGKHLFVFSHYNINDGFIQQSTAFPYAEEEYFFLDSSETYGVDYFISGHLHEKNDSVIRGTNYLTVKNTVQRKEAGLLIEVNGDFITTSWIDIPPDSIQKTSKSVNEE